MKREEIAAHVETVAGGIESNAGSAADLAARAALVALGVDLLTNVGRIADALEGIAMSVHSIDVHGSGS